VRPRIFLEALKKEVGMSYQNQSESDHLEIIVGPPGTDKLINSVHNVAAAQNITLDDAWTVYVKLMAEKFIKPNEYGLRDFSEIFTDLLEQDVRVSEYFLTHYVHTFSNDGQLLTQIKDVSKRQPYLAPAIIFHAKDILDSKGKPINIRIFDKLKREILQNLMIFLMQASWIHVSISFEYTKIKAK